MNKNNSAGSNSEEPGAIKKVFIISKDDVDTDTVTIEGPARGYRNTVRNYAKLWYGETAVVDFKSLRIIVISDKAVERVVITGALLNELFVDRRTGSTLFSMLNGGDIAVRIVPSSRRNKKLYKILHDAQRKGLDYLCSRQQLIKYDKLVKILRARLCSKYTNYL